ncbi:hypothetical protein ACIBHX_46920 [Nonomuraea sp. NPDC050536]|uniref:hypothetical protein n=1 Tax=Nonomuraea sp. NPDC050536 TaxID=3364366 RepID=UPI0037C70724
MISFRTRAIAWRISITGGFFALAAMAAWLERPRGWSVAAAASLCLWFAFWLIGRSATYACPRLIRQLRAVAKARSVDAVTTTANVMVWSSKARWVEMTIYRAVLGDLVEARADLDAGAHISTVSFEIFIVRGRYQITRVIGSHAVQPAPGSDTGLIILPQARSSGWRILRAFNTASKSGITHITHGEIEELIEQLRCATPPGLTPPQSR